MNKFFRYTLYIFTLLVITVGTGIISYRLSDFTLDSTKTSAITLESDTSRSEKELIEISNKVNEVLLGANAKFIFESEYENKESDIKEISVPKVFVGANQELIKNSFNEWDIIEFTENKVYFKQLVETQEPMYVLTSENEFLVVYYKDSEGNVTLEEETGIYTGTLPEVDVEKIKQGIVYKSKSDLLMALQNYDS